MGQRSPFLYSFQSPYSPGETLELIVKSLIDIYRDPHDHKRTMLEQHFSDDDRPLAITPYISWFSREHGVQLTYGNKARTYWMVTIEFEQNAKGTHASMNLDRRKKDVDVRYYGELMRVHQLFNQHMRDGCGFESTGWDSTLR